MSVFAILQKNAMSELLKACPRWKELDLYESIVINLLKMGASATDMPRRTHIRNKKRRLQYTLRCVTV